MVAGAATSFAPRHIAIAPAIAALPAPASMSSSSPSPPPPNGLLGKAARTGGGGAHARKLTAGSSPASSKGTRAQQAAAVAAAATVTSADKVSKDPKEPVDDQEKCCHHDKVRQMLSPHTNGKLTMISLQVRSDRLKVACMTPGCVKVFCTRCLELQYVSPPLPAASSSSHSMLLAATRSSRCLPVQTHACCALTAARSAHAHAAVETVARHPRQCRATQRTAKRLHRARRQHQASRPLRTSRRDGPRQHRHLLQHRAGRQRMSASLARAQGS